MKRNEKLIDATCWCEQGMWYMSLTYEYDGKDGKHVTVYPKVMFPFPIFAVPAVSRVDTASYPTLNTPGRTPILEAPVRNPVTYEYLKKGYAFDFLTEPVVREMTIEEIEKELGHKVKIVNKEDKDG